MSFYQNSKGKCQSSCAANEYILEEPSGAKGVLGSFSCELCDERCKTCLSGSSSSCTSCDKSKASTAVFSEGKCISKEECPVNAKVTDGKCVAQPNSQCKASSNCEQCGPGKTFCYACKSGYVLDGSSGKCIIKSVPLADTPCVLPNYYTDTDSICKRCGTDCKTCKSGDKCETCQTYFGKYY